MTTPSNPPQEGTEGAPPPENPAPAAEAAPPAAPPPPQDLPPVPAGPPGQPWPPTGYPYPFAPVYRAPRTPWITPARRGQVAAAAIVGALVFAGGGLVIGHAVADRGDIQVRHGVVGIEPGRGMDGPGLGRGQLPRRKMGPRQQRPNAPAPAPTPSPSPSGSPTR
jgi:hypothetical protein